MRKLIKNSTVIILMLLILMILFMNKNNLADNLPIRYMLIKSNSMYPVFQKNDIVIIKKQENYQIGDIITYNYQNKYFITHRIININDNGLITKGDNNNCEDLDNVSINSVKGKVILIIRKEQIFIILLILIISISLIGIIKEG